MSEKFDWGLHTVGETIVLAGMDTRQSLDQAQAYCSQIAKAHYENFIISNHFTPPHIRQHIENIYAFCRYGDDLGDEAPFPPEIRWSLLDEWEKDIVEASIKGWNGNPRHPINLAVQHTARHFQIPLKPFVDLIQAFKMDQEKLEYATWDELRSYCSFSADPVGHLFLYVYGHDDDELRTLSDFTCTALQLANHWQDIARDHAQQRCYIPLETMENFNYTREDFSNKVDDERWKSIIQFEVDRAQAWFDEGKALWAKVDPHLAVDLEMFTLGGEAILQSIRKQQYTTWKKRPTVSKFKQATLFFGAKRRWKKASKRK